MLNDNMIVLYDCTGLKRPVQSYNTNITTNFGKRYK